MVEIESSVQNTEVQELGSVIMYFKASYDFHRCSQFPNPVLRFLSCLSQRKKPTKLFFPR